MKILKEETKLCFLCLEIHEVKTVEVIDRTVVDNSIVGFNVVLEYCSNADEYLANEEMISKNTLSRDNAIHEVLRLNSKGKNISKIEKYKGDGVVDTKKELCLMCLDVHEVQKVRRLDRYIYNNVLVAYEVILNYCDNEEAYFEDMMSNNSLRSVKAYERILKINNTPRVDKSTY